MADGIAAAGVQQTHPTSDVAEQGLLPDSFNLRAQTRNEPGINPATLLPEALQMFGQDPVYDLHVFLHHALMVHAPGPITDCVETSQLVSFRVTGWPGWPWFLLIQGFPGGPFLVNGIETTAAPGPLILGLNEPATVEIPAPAVDTLRIERAAPGAGLKVSWSLAATNYVLETAAALSADAPWQPLRPTTTEGSENVLLIPADQPLQFLRLRRQP